MQALKWTRYICIHVGLICIHTHRHTKGAHIFILEGGREGGSDGAAVSSPSVSHPQDLNHLFRGPNPIVYCHTGQAGGAGIQHGPKRGKAVLPYPVAHTGRHCDDRAGEEAWREEEKEEGGSGAAAIAAAAPPPFPPPPAAEEEERRTRRGRSRRRMRRRKYKMAARNKQAGICAWLPLHSPFFLPPFSSSSSCSSSSGDGTINTTKNTLSRAIIKKPKTQTSKIYPAFSPPRCSLVSFQLKVYASCLF